MRLNLRNFRASKLASVLTAIVLVLGIGVIASAIIKNNVQADTSSLVGQRTDVEPPIVSPDDGTSKVTADRVFAEADLARIYSGHFGSTGVLGNFHIIALNNFIQKQQAYGNIAVNHLDGQGNNIAHFDIPTINYIKSTDTDVNLHSFYAGSDHANSSVLVVGDEVNAGGKRSPNAEDGFGELWQFNGYDLNGPKRKDGESSNVYYDNLWKEDANGPEFLNFDAVKADAIEQNRILRNLEDTNTVTGTTSRSDSTMNLKYLRVQDDDGINVVTIDAYDLLEPTTEIEVVGFDQSKPSSLIVNVDLKDYPDFQLKSGFRICYDSGKTIEKYNDIMSGWHHSHEAELIHSDSLTANCLDYKTTSYQYPNHIVLNVFDSSKPDGIYTGTISTVNHSSSTIIAPGATVHVVVDGLQGEIIANNIDLDGDSYYLSLSDQTPVVEESYNLTVSYKWEDGSEAYPTQESGNYHAGDTWNEVGPRNVSYHGTAIDNYPGEIVLDPAFDVASGTFTDHDIHVQFIYKMHTLDVIYAEEGEGDNYTEISHKDRQMIVDGGNYTETPIDLSAQDYEYVGLHSTSSPASKTGMNRNETVIFLYKKKTYNLIVTYKWEDGSDAAPSKESSNHLKGESWNEAGVTSVSYHGTTIDNYPGEIVLDPAFDAASGTFNNRDIHVQFIYKMHTLDVIYAEEGKNDSYTEISHKDRQMIVDGGSYSEEPIDLSAQNYEYVGVHSTSSPTSKDGMNRNETVIFIYKKQTPDVPVTPDEPVTPDVPVNPDTSSKNLWFIGLGGISLMAIALFAVNKFAKR